MNKDWEGNKRLLDKMKPWKKNNKVNNEQFLFLQQPPGDGDVYAQDKNIVMSVSKTDMEVKGQQGRQTRTQVRR